MSAAFTKALEIANSLGDSEYQLRALRGLYLFNVVSSRFRTALPFAQKFYDLTARGSDPNDKLFGAQLVGSAEHYVGDHRSARLHLELALSRHLRPDPHANVIRFQTDVCVAARSFLARVLWLQGFPDQARHEAEKSAEDARGSDALSLCYALALASCPIALWQGDLASAGRYAELLLDHAREHNFPIWIRFGSNFKGVLAIRSGDVDAGLRLLRVGFDGLSDRKSGFRSLTGLSELVGGPEPCRARSWRDWRCSRQGSISPR